MRIGTSRTPGFIPAATWSTCYWRVGAGVLTYQVAPEFWLATGWVWLFVALGLLILVLIPGVGRDVNGSQRWLPLGPLTLQPSEFTKIALVIYLAGYMVRREHEVRNQWQGFLKPMAVLFAATLLLMMEPDFGATVIVAGSAFGMLFLAGVKLGHFLLVSGGAVAAGVVLIVSAPYRLKRLTAYTDPWADPYDTGFQLTQSLIAFGRGEWLGVGLGNSVQKLFYLPEAHTDFVFSIWAEETGFVGALAVISLFAALIGRIFWAGRNALAAANPFGAYICYGVALVFTGQAFVNMGVSCGLLPTKGLDPALCQLRRHQPDCLLQHARPGAAYRARHPRPARGRSDGGAATPGTDDRRRHRRPCLSGAGGGHRADGTWPARGVGGHRQGAGAPGGAGGGYNPALPAGARCARQIHAAQGAGPMVPAAGLRSRPCGCCTGWRRVAWSAWAAMSPAPQAWRPGCCASRC